MDQKDIQAAIKSCEDRIKHIKSVPDYQPGKRQRKRAIELEHVKIAALTPPTQEQLERVWGADWLNFYGEYSEAECSKCGDLFEVSPDEQPRKEYFDAFKQFYKFCPSCGAAMTPEAMEIVRKRLEEMNDGEND